MVDGVKVSERISSSAKERYGEDGTPLDNSGNTYVDQQDFQDADMVVIKRRPLSVSGELLDKRKTETGKDPTNIAKLTVYECYGIYGNVLVTATVNKKNIKEINKKYVWSYRKPYLLNGVQCGNNIL